MPHLGTIHVIIEVSKCNLRLNHPELSKMARCIGLLRSERRAKGIDRTEGGGIVLGVELPRHRQEGWLAEEVFTIVDLHKCPGLAD